MAAMVMPENFHQEPGELYGTPKEVWGFRTAARDLSAPVESAKDFLKANHELFGFNEKLSSLKHQRTIESLGAHHVIFQQLCQRERIHRAYVTVHVNLRGQIYMCKSRAVPRSCFPKKTGRALSQRAAVRAAQNALPDPSRSAKLLYAEKMWFPWEAQIIPVWRVVIARSATTSAANEEWIVHVEDADYAEPYVVDLVDNIAHAPRRPRALVFDPSPVAALGHHHDLMTAGLQPRQPPWEAYRLVTLHGLKGNGYLDGRRATTRLTRKRINRPDNEFMLAAGERGFEEVMTYHHVDSAIRYLESLGYKGRRAIFRKPIEIDATAGKMDNAWYSPGRKSLNFGTGFINEAEDGDTILHEFGHAVQDFICPNYGQTDEAAALGEGFADYLAASYFADKKPEDYRPCVCSWDGLLIGLREGQSPACLRRVDKTKTYRDFVNNVRPHINGEIWSATLWDIRKEVGRKAADTLILESQFQQDAFTNFVRAARAIVHADRNLNKGRNEEVLMDVFKRRKIKVVV